MNYTIATATTAATSAATPLSTSTSTLTSSIDIEQLIAKIQAPSSQIRQAEARQIKEPNEYIEPNPWLVRFGAAAHLSGYSERHDWLRGLVATVSYQEPGARREEKG